MSAAAELDRYRVVDLSRGLSGAYCAKMFSDAGADVIVVEPGDGHPHRRWSCAGTVAAGEDGALFRYLRHGQRSTHGDSVIATADVVIVESVDEARAASARPDAVVVVMSPFGSTGPYADRPASELTVQAESGALGIRGRPDRPPVQAGGQITEWVTGAYAAVAALACLRAGTGQRIDVSWAEVANITCTLFIDLLDGILGRPALDAPRPTRSFETPSIEPTLDGFVGFNTNTRQQFEDFLVMIERFDLLADLDTQPSWAALGTRAAKWDEWNEIVHDWTTKHTTAEIVEQAALLRIPVAPVCNAEMLLALEHPSERGVFIDDPTGTFRMPRRPWTLDGEPAPLHRPAPALGEHDDAIEPRHRHFSAAPVSDGTPRPLAGLTVVDLTAWWAGPSMANMLAVLGADVIHVESTKRPDGIRMAGGAFAGNRDSWWDLSSMFLSANTNKRGITLDLSVAAGRALLLRLVERADVVVENFTPRVLESFDLGWAVIHATNPRTVMVRMPAFGLDGPWRDRPGFAQTMEQMTTLAWLTGHVDDQPRIQRGPCDPNGGMHAAFATLVALARRDRTGVGVFVEAPMFEAAVAVAAEPVLEWTAYGTALDREGNRSPRAAPQNVYACAGAEQWLALSVLDDHQWAALVDVLGSPDWAIDARLADHRGRRQHHDLLDQYITAWAAAQDRDSAVIALVAAGVPAAAVVEPRRTSEHAQFRAREFFETLDHAIAGPLATPGPPFRFAGVDHWLHRAAPMLGEHNTEVLTDLGCTVDELSELTAAGVIGARPIGL